MYRENEPPYTLAPNDGPRDSDLSAWQDLNLESFNATLTFRATVSPATAVAAPLAFHTDEYPPI